MTEHQSVNDEIRETASLFAAGALPPREQAEFEAHAKTCGVCAGEARAFSEAAGWLPFSGAGAAPSPFLRDRLLARIGQPKPAAGIRVVRANEGAWFTLVPGVTAKRLYQESPTGTITLLVRMEPGAKYPPHSHGGVEHAYVLEGDLHFGDLVLGPGDYQCADEATEHGDSFTVGGCKVLIIASQQNAFLPWTS